jgi:predicted DNA-binding protein
MTTTETEQPRKKGRPARSGQGRMSLHVRFTPERMEMLKVLADRNGRSLSEQVEYVVERYFADLQFHGVSEKQLKAVVDAAAKRVIEEIRKLR